MNAIQTTRRLTMVLLRKQRRFDRLNLKAFSALYCAKRSLGHLPICICLSTLSKIGLYLKGGYTFDHAVLDVRCQRYGRAYPDVTIASQEYIVSSLPHLRILRSMS